MALIDKEKINDDIVVLLEKETLSDNTAVFNVRIQTTGNNDFISAMCTKENEAYSLFCDTFINLQSVFKSFISDK